MNEVIRPKEKIVITDVDGVLLQWLASFEPWMIKRGYPRRPDSDHEWNIAKRHANLTYDEGAQCVMDFNHSDEIRYLKPLADSVECVRKLADEGFKFIAVTSLSDDPIAKENRIYNLEQAFGDMFDEVHCLKIGESKQHILGEKWGGTGYIWLEDHFKNAESGYEVGLKPVLVDDTHNRKYQTELFPRVGGDTPWAEIYEIIHRMYK